MRGKPKLTERSEGNFGGFPEVSEDNLSITETRLARKDLLVDLVEL